jgi:hypothetical protein
VGIYRSFTGQWFLDANNNGMFDTGDFTYGFGGVAGDLPVVGNWNNVQGTSGYKDCIGVFRSGFFWVLDLNCNGSYDGTRTNPFPDAAFPFGGIAGDVPVVGAWFGGTTHVGVVRKYQPSGGASVGNPFYWAFDAGAPSAGQMPASHQPAYAYCFAFGGVTGDVYLSGDWYNTGTSMAGVFRSDGIPGHQGFEWVLDSAPPGSPQASRYVPGFAFNLYGVAGDVPVTGRW